MTAGTRRAIAMGMLCGAALAITYSWTFTPIGRIDYRAALFARVKHLVGGELEISASAREARKRYRGWLIPDEVPAESVRVEDRVVMRDGNEIPIRIYTPAGEEPKGFYLYLHGGGWWAGDGFPFDERQRLFAEQSGAIVVSVDYRLAPEHPFPAALEDCTAVLHWLAEEGGALGGDPTRLAVGGSSAGGNLAAALALEMRATGGPRIAFQYLFVPATDLSGTRDWHSYDEAGVGYGLTVADFERMIEAYVPDARQRMDPFVSPLLEGDLSGLPPALVVTAQFDPLRDQGEAYARRLEAAGVPVRLHREPSAIHALVGSPQRARRVLRMAAEAVREALHADPQDTISERRPGAV